MNKRLIIILGAGIILLVGGFLLFNSYIYNEKQADARSDYKKAQYIIDGQSVELEDDSNKAQSTRFFGNELVADLNNDGRNDVVFIITHQTSGSGTFYYVVPALNTEEGYVGGEGYLLGDRIAPQTVELSQNPSHQNVVVINYVDRAPGEPMTAEPSVGKSVWLKLDPQSMQFGVVEQNFEGEADPSRMSLTMKDWTWVSATYNDGTMVEPAQADSFVLSFKNGGQFSAKTDCNSLSGSYVVNDGQISFSQIVMTQMFCEGSQENVFATLLENTQTYHFNSRGQLILDLKFDSGSVIFR